MFQDVPQQLANTVLHGGEAFGIIFEVEHRGHGSDDRVNVLAPQDVRNLKKAARFLMLSLFGVICNPEVLKQSHSCRVAAPFCEIAYRDFLALSAPPRTPRRCHS